MVTVGVHVSIAGSLLNAFDRAKERECDCFQLFTKNPRGWNAKPIDEETATLFRKAVDAFSTGPVFAHLSYLPNFAGDKPDMYKKSVDALLLELSRCELLAIPYLILHLGHAGDSVLEGKKRVVTAIDTAVEEMTGDTIFLLENTAGEKNSVGSRIEDVADVFSQVSDQKRIGLCMDTCHAFAAGYDLRDETSVGVFTDTIEDCIGLTHLKLIHLNDTKGPLGSGLDRHEHIGLGLIGEEGLSAVLRSESLAGIPCICETPVDDRRGDLENVRFVRTLADKNYKEKASSGFESV